MHANDLGDIGHILERLEITLDDEQPHISGERFLQSPHKLVLLGKGKSGRVVVKVSCDLKGKQEIAREKKARDTLQKLAFASDVLLMPEELYFGEQGPYTLFITAYVTQKDPFVNLPQEEQFFSILRAFEAQEAFHATTWEHGRMIKGAFAALRAEDYLENFEEYIQTIGEHYPKPELAATLTRAKMFLREHTVDIERYCGYLTHSDLAPHNFRSAARQLYMLDYTAIQFGNKYEGWARFLNFMLIHNPTLERMLTKYVQQERGEGEYLVLRLMRVYKIGFLLKYYAGSLLQTKGDLHTLIEKRLEYWSETLSTVLNDAVPSEEARARYLEARALLRSPQEVARQKEIAHL